MGSRKYGLSKKDISVYLMISQIKDTSEKTKKRKKELTEI